MSFAADTKNEMCKSVPQRSCCRRAECYGLLLAGVFKIVGLYGNRKMPLSPIRWLNWRHRWPGSSSIYAVLFSRKKENHNTFSVFVEGDDQRERLLSVFGHEAGEMNLRIHKQNFLCPDCLAAFLRGAFLCCGTVTDPNKEYHLEFVVPYSNLAKDLLCILQTCGVENLQPGLSNRRGRLWFIAREWSRLRMC